MAGLATVAAASSGAILNARTLPEIFDARVALTPDRLAYRQPTDDGRWIDWTWRRVGEQVGRWRAALAAEALPPGSRVATIMRSSVDYVLVDQAALSLGLVIVPLHNTDNPGNVGFILNDSEIAVLVLDDAANWTRLAPEVSAIPTLKRIVIVTDPTPEAFEPADPRAVDAARWLAEAPAFAGPPPAVRPETLATIVYTSGTTGRPKGVMLSHTNIVSNVLSVLGTIEARDDDVYLSFLPLSHTFERTSGYYLPIAAGSCVAFARSTSLLMEDMKFIAPTILVSVPRIYERAYARIRELSAAKGALARRLGEATERLGWRRFLASQGRAEPLSWAEALVARVLDRLVAQRIRAAFGGRLRLGVAGGAPMPPAVSRFFLALGVPIIQGYGMTETSPVVSVNRPNRNEPDTVGEPIPGVEVRIGDLDELMVRGPNVMLGYWKRPEETRQIQAEDGWLHSGDQALLRDGQIVIKGRIKDIIVTSTGEKISPSDLERAILEDPFFEQILVIGEQRPFISALAVVNSALLAQELARLGLSPSAPDAQKLAAVRESALKRLQTAAASFPSYATPRKVALTLEPWTVAAGLITPTLKTKRRAILEHFAVEVEQLYAKG